MVALDGGVVETTAERADGAAAGADPPGAGGADRLARAEGDGDRGRLLRQERALGDGRRPGQRGRDAGRRPARRRAASPTRRRRSRWRSAAPAAPARSQVQRMVGTLLGLPEPPTPDHAADALAVAICHGGGAGHRRRRRLRLQRRAAGAAGRMIAAVRGEVMVRRPDHVVIDAAGVGYRLTVSSETLKAVPATRQRRLPARRADRPRGLAGALRLLLRGGARPLPPADLGQRRRPQSRDRDALRGHARELLRAIAAGDAKRFQAVPGIGKRTAERIIVELREKVAGSARGGGGDRRGRGRRRRARSPATASSTSATRRWRPSSCSTASMARTRRSWSRRRCARRRGEARMSDSPDIGANRIRTPGHRRGAGPGRRRGPRPRRPRRRARRGPRPLAAAADPRRLRQPGPGDRAAGDLHRGRARARRAARPRPARRPARARQDLAGPHRRRRAGRADGADRRPGAGAQGRRRLLPHLAGAGQRLLHRRDPPPRPRRRGDPLPGDGGRRAAGRARPGRRRPHRDPAAAALHADRRDHPRRPADDAAARPLRRLATGSSTTAPSTWR